MDPWGGGGHGRTKSMPSQQWTKSKRWTKSERWTKSNGMNKCLK